MEYSNYRFTFTQASKILKYEVKEQSAILAVLTFQLKFPSIKWFTVLEEEIPFPYNLQK